MATIKFLLQSKSITSHVYLRISLGRGKTIKRKSGSICNYKDWSTTSGFPKPNSESNKNIKLNLKKLESFIIDKFNEDYSKGILIDGDWLQTTIDKFNGLDIKNIENIIDYAEYFIEKLPFNSNRKGKKRTSKATITKYKTIIRKLKGFEEYKKKAYLIKEIDLSFRNNFLQYLFNKENISDNTSGRYISVVKSIVLDARKNGYAVSHQINDFKGYTVKPPIVTVTFEEIEIIKKFDFIKKNHSIARDWFIIGCFVGQRASDLFRINNKMIEHIKGINFITLKQVKTDELVQIPIHKEVKEILKKWKGNFPPTFSENNDSNSAMFNKFIKEVFKIANINEITKGNLNNPETNRYETGLYLKWKLISSHTCRRSFATNFYAKREYPTPLLMSVTGHKTEKMFLNYIGKKPIDYAIQLAKIWAKKEKL
jgi:integrase